MTQITAQQVKELRDITNVGMMECKKALQETEGDIDAAVKLLRERGMAVAAKKADRAANEGQVDIAVSGDGKTGAMVEVNCETDFVAKNENFQGFVAELAAKGLNVDDNELADAEKENVAVKISEIGENLILARNTRYELQGPGAIGRYIHDNLADVVERWELCAFNNACQQKYDKLDMAWTYEGTPLMDQLFIDHIEQVALTAGTPEETLVISGLVAKPEA